MKRMLLATTAFLIAARAFAGELPEGWYPVGDEGMKRYLLDVDPAHGFSGPGLRVTSQDEVAGSFGGVGQAISAKKYAGKTVRVTAYLKTADVSEGYAGLWFRVDRSRDTIAFDNMHDRGIEGTTDWQPYECVLRVDPDASKILFGAILTGTGSLYADEFTLEVVPDSTPTTGSGGAGMLPKDPSNLGF